MKPPTKKNANGLLIHCNATANRRKATILPQPFLAWKLRVTFEENMQAQIG